MRLIPKCFTQGVTVSTSASLSDYPASTWTLTLVLVQADDQRTITATADGDDYLVEIEPTDSADYQVGTYSYQAFVTDGTDRYMVQDGTVEVLPDYATASSGLDTRTQIEITIDAIEAQLAGNATGTQKRWKYRDREIEQYAPAELIEILNYLRLELRRQKRRSGSNRIQASFR
ncbi:hypothetical protein F3N42_03685 [Marinihelvus fidelis]|uniref:Uncharacterized protein n=1 Tax=Marinihelvus fidelis TaxID=2613842 RepID=A0A5N0TG52_9GAMM|nr:hypothetical protein [Marinihelvus fidelis]KAA9133464.1 hypothetical protein F3N42_03685 [Marinihelvus fidelis]